MQQNNQPDTARSIAGKARAYIVELSNGRKIKCDADEVERVIGSITTGSVCKLRQGLFNPSFFVDLVEDEERIKDFRRTVYQIEDGNNQDREYHDGKNQRELPRGLKSLADILSGTKLKPTDDSIKKLNSSNQQQ